jgi:hypothetical protein
LIGRNYSRILGKKAMMWTLELWRASVLLVLV